LRNGQQLNAGGPILSHSVGNNQSQPNAQHQTGGAYLSPLKRPARIAGTGGAQASMTQQFGSRQQ